MWSVAWQVLKVVDFHTWGLNCKVKITGHLLWGPIVVLLFICSQAFLNNDGIILFSSELESSPPLICMYMKLNMYINFISTRPLVSLECHIKETTRSWKRSQYYLILKPPYFITGDIKLKVQGDVSASVDLKGSRIEYDRTLPFRDLKFTEDHPTSLEGTSTLTLCPPPHHQHGQLNFTLMCIFNMDKKILVFCFLKRGYYGSYFFQA